MNHCTQLFVIDVVRRATQRGAKRVVLEIESSRSWAVKLQAVHVDRAWHLGAVAIFLRSE